MTDRTRAALKHIFQPFWERKHTERHLRAKLENRGGPELRETVHQRHVWMKTDASHHHRALNPSLDTTIQEKDLLSTYSFSSGHDTISI